MAVYVLVDGDGIDKRIKFGPLELADPTTYLVPEGLEIMAESDALAQGYQYTAGGAAVAPGEPDGSDGDNGEHHGHGRGRHGGEGAQNHSGDEHGHPHQH